MFEIYLPIANMMVDSLEIIILGIFVGFLAGLFGIGGGFIMVPLLNIVLGIPMNIAIGSNLTQVAATSSSGAVAHKKMGNIDMKLASLILMGSIVGVSLGVILLGSLKASPAFDLIIKGIYILLLTVIGLLMLVESALSAKRTEQRQIIVDISKKFQDIGFMSIELPKSGIRIPAFLPIMMGLGVGIIAGVTGIGGGFIMVPLLIYIVGVRTVIAIGTDIFQMIFLAAVGSIGHALNGNVDLYLAILMLIGSSIGAQFGARTTRRVKAAKIRLLLAVIITMVVLHLIMDVIGWFK